MIYRLWIYLLSVSFYLSMAYAYDWSENPGDGTPENPYLISEPNQLISINSNIQLLDRCFRLTGDIVFDPVNNPAHVFTAAVITPDTDPVESGYQGTPFYGRLDGAGHSISNLTIDQPNGDYLGLFGKLSSAEVFNLELKNVNIRGRASVGSLAGAIFAFSHLKNCSTYGRLEGTNYTGGLVGVASSHCIISKCEALVSVIGIDYVGGLLGGLGTINTLTGCRSDGNIEGTFRVGGLVGLSFNNNYIGNCAAAGNVLGVNETGGLLGASLMTDLVAFCCASASVNGIDYVGGLIGNSDNSLLHCYSVGNVSGETRVGGLVGAYPVNNVGCYFLQTAGPANGSGQPLNDSQMKQQASFIGWDFLGNSADGLTETWTMPDEPGYPQLSQLLMEPPVLLSGSGIETDPYQIAGPNELAMMNWYPKDAYFLLTTGIDMGSIIWPIAPVTYFRGTLNGQGHNIRNLTIDSDVGRAGLFAVLSMGGGIRNMLLENLSITGKGRIGGLAAQNHGDIYYCSSSGSIISTTGSPGGLVGINELNGMVSSCFSTCSVIGDRDVGGLVASNWGGSIFNCYASGPVSGNTQVGGLVGLFFDGRISHSYAAGPVNGFTSRLVGKDYYGDFFNSYHLVMVDSIAVAGYGYSQGLLDEQMKQRASFKGWYFGDRNPDAKWRMCVDGIHYPRLAWEFGQTGDFVCPDGVGIEDLEAVASVWLERTDSLYSQKITDTNADGVTDLTDWEILSTYWQLP